MNKLFYLLFNLKSMDLSHLFLFILLFLPFKPEEVIRLHEENNISTYDEITLFESLVNDGAFMCDSKNFELYSDCLQNLYKYWELECSKLYELEFESPNRKYHMFYKVQLFKIKPPLYNTYFYMMKYEDIYSVNWIRLKGYKENDFNIFLDLCTKRYMTRKQTLNEIAKWQTMEPLFEEVNINCLKKEAKKNKVKKIKCMTSNVKLWNYRSENGLSTTTYDHEDELYEQFSYRPFKRY